MKTSNKKIIGFSILYAFIAIVLIFSIVFCLFYFAFTKKLADISYSFGNEKFASNLYYKEYEKNGNIADCYKALNLKIKLKDDKGIVKIYKSYIEDKNYNNFNDSIKKHNINLKCSILEKSAILNDENYLENKYIKAMINLNMAQKAFDRSVNNFVNYLEFTFEEQGLYNLNYFINSNYDFSVVYSGYSLNLLESMQDYFDKSIVLFESKKDTSDNLSKSYLLSLCNRLLLVGQNINSLYKNNNSNLSQIENNNFNMQIINNTIKDIL